MVVEPPSGSEGLAPAFEIGSAGAIHRPEIERILALPFPQERSILDRQARTLDGMPYRELEHGGMSRGVYSFLRGGAARILKALYPTDDYDPEDGPDAAEQWRAGLVGALFGAPQVHRAGLVRDGGRELYFLEMDELFPGRNARSLKRVHASAVDGRDERPWLRRLAHPRADGRRPTQDMAALIVSALEHGVHPVDRDFFVAEDGEVAWIDTNLWTVAPDNRFLKGAVPILGVLNMLEDEPEAYQSFYLDFLSALKGSRVLDDETKDRLLRRSFLHGYEQARLLYDHL